MKQMKLSSVNCECKQNEWKPNKQSVIKINIYQIANVAFLKCCIHTIKLGQIEEGDEEKTSVDHMHVYKSRSDSEMRWSDINVVEMPLKEFDGECLKCVRFWGKQSNIHSGVTGNRGATMQSQNAISFS